MASGGEQDTRERIVKAAMRVFAEHGLLKAPTQLVAREAGVSKSLIFWYFHSRDELVREVAMRATPLDIIEGCLSKGLEGAELLRCVGEAYYGKYSEQHMRMLLLQVLSARGLLPYVDELLDKLCGEKLREIARRVWGSESLEARVKARMFLGSLLCYALNPPGDISPKDYLDTVIKVLVRTSEGK